MDLYCHGIIHSPGVERPVLHLSVEHHLDVHVIDNRSAGRYSELLESDTTTDSCRRGKFTHKGMERCAPFAT